MPYYDYEASVAELSLYLKGIKNSDWSPTPQVQNLLSFARQLEDTADLMGDECWLSVEERTDADPPPAGGLHGFPISNGPEESNRGFFQATKWRLRTIAECARNEANSYPDPRARPENLYAAEVFLHIWYQCEKDRPSLYDKSEALAELCKIRHEAGLNSDPSTVRKTLANALKNFDPAFDPPGLDRFLVLSQ